MRVCSTKQKVRSIKVYSTNKEHKEVLNKLNVDTMGAGPASKKVGTPT